MRAAMLSQGLRPGLAALAALLLLDGALTLGSGVEAQRRGSPPAGERFDERSEARPDAPADSPRESEARGVRAIVPVLTEREKRCRQLHQCAMTGPCPACPR